MYSATNHINILSKKIINEAGEMSIPYIVISNQKQYILYQHLYYILFSRQVT